MAIQLHNLRPFKGSKVGKKRIGRGLGSNWGTTAGRGQNGQKSRSGVGGLKRLGMKKLLLSTPKVRGFKAIGRKASVVNVGTLSELFEAGALVTTQILKDKRLIPNSASGLTKILGHGTIDKALRIKGCQVSASAAAKITAAGGEVIGKK